MQGINTRGNTEHEHKEHNGPNGSQAKPVLFIIRDRAHAPSQHSRMIIIPHSSPYVNCKHKTT